MPERPNPLRVLIVEDSEDDYDLLLLRLRQAGFEPSGVRVETMGEVNDAMASSAWHIVISDFDLPGFDAFRALELVRKSDALVPFFIISGAIDEEQAVASMRAGANDFFYKGNLARLGRSINRELEAAAKQREHSERLMALDRDRNILRHDRIRFVDVMSHELRTPLQIVNLAAGMLALYGERMDAPERMERTTEIQNAVVRMTRVIDKVLLTSRMELRRWEVRSEAFELGPWCEEFVAQNTSEGDQRLRVRLQLRDLPPRVAMDPRLVEIALQNLLSNALKYSPDGAPVDLEVRGGLAGRIEFTVRDCGIGIPEADLCQLGGSFYRGSNVGGIQGTGLGLAIVKGCTDLHGGALEITSEPGQGTCVRMRLPDWLHSKPPTGEYAAANSELSLA